MFLFKICLQIMFNHSKLFSEVGHLSRPHTGNPIVAANHPPQWLDGVELVLVSLLTGLEIRNLKT